MKKIVITGAAGFIGSNLVDRLLNEGFFVYGIDNLITGSLDNLSHLNSNNNFDFVNYDVTKYIDIKDKIDYVFHFASPASPIDYLKYPIQTLKANAIGGRNEKAVKEYLEKNWTADMAETDAVQLTVKALLEVVDSGAKNMEIAIMRDGAKVHMLPEVDLQTIIEAIEKEQEEAKKNQSENPNLVGGI